MQPSASYKNGDGFNNSNSTEAGITVFLDRFGSILTAEKSFSLLLM